MCFQGQKVAAVIFIILISAEAAIAKGAKPLEAGKSKGGSAKSWAKQGGKMVVGGFLTGMTFIFGETAVSYLLGATGSEEMTVLILLAVLLLGLTSSCCCCCFCVYGFMKAKKTGKKVEIELGEFKKQLINPA